MKTPCLRSRQCLCSLVSSSRSSSGARCCTVAARAVAGPGEEAQVGLSDHAVGHFTSVKVNSREEALNHLPVPVGNEELNHSPARQTNSSLLKLGTCNGEAVAW